MGRGIGKSISIIPIIETGLTTHETLNRTLSLMVQPQAARVYMYATDVTRAARTAQRHHYYMYSYTRDA